MNWALKKFVFFSIVYLCLIFILVWFEKEEILHFFWLRIMFFVDFCLKLSTEQWKTKNAFKRTQFVYELLTQQIKITIQLKFSNIGMNWLCLVFVWLTEFGKMWENKRFVSLYSKNIKSRWGAPNVSRQINSG